MRKQVRQSVFETNSSSVHTLTLSQNGMKSRNCIKKDEDGYVTVKIMNLKKKTGRLTTPRQKLAYIISVLYYESGGSIYALKKNYDFDIVEERINKYCGSKGIKIEDLPLTQRRKIDFQDLRDERPYLVLCPYGNYGVNEVIFNKYLYINMIEDGRDYVSYDEKGLEPSNLPVDDDGYIIGRFGEFDKELNIYTTQSDKLAYILTNLYYMSGWDYEEIHEHPAFYHLEKILAEYCHCEGIKIDDSVEPYIDHQSIPEYGEAELLDIYDEREIIEFIFNKYVGIMTDCD